MLESIFEGIKSFLGDTLTSVFEAVLNATIFKLLYYAETGLCWIISQLYSMFEVFAGLVRIRYDDKYDYLINVFFTNSAVSNIYWAMALIGIALTFGFAIWSVARKMFDADGKQQQSLGQIAGAGLKSIFLILSMTLIISVVLTMTNTLMEQIDFMFNNAYHLSYPEERDFSEEEYAAMGRVLATIGNASMVPNSRNRYNVNLCYNEIRGDMLYLQGNDPIRVQCAFVDTPEVDAINQFIAQQQGYSGPFELPEPVMDESSDIGGGNDVDMGHLDPMFEDAARLIVMSQQGSTSLIQRKFAIGYNRAGRLMDQLEKAGIVGAAHGSKPREVLIQDEVSLDNLISSLRGR